MNREIPKGPKIETAHKLECTQKIAVVVCWLYFYKILSQRKKKRKRRKGSRLGIEPGKDIDILTPI